MKKNISTAYTSTSTSKILELLQDDLEKLEEWSRLFPPEKLQQPLAKGKRSFTETLAHLINVEARTSEAIYRALLENEPLMAEIHPERDWGNLLRFDLLDFFDLLAYFKLRRQVLLRVLSVLTEDEWSRTIREAGKKRKESIYWLARSLVLHEGEHLQDITDKLGQTKKRS